MWAISLGQNGRKGMSVCTTGPDHELLALSLNRALTTTRVGTLISTWIWLFSSSVGWITISPNLDRSKIKVWTSCQGADVRSHCRLGEAKDISELCSSVKLVDIHHLQVTDNPVIPLTSVGQRSEPPIQPAAPLWPSEGQVSLAPGGVQRGLTVTAV